MSDTFYHVRKYVTFTSQEFVGIILTALVAGLTVSMRDLLFEHFGEGIALVRCGLTILFLFCAIVIAVWISKIFGARLGYVVVYQAHILALIIGAIISFITQGFLPLFLSGGFLFDQPDRLRVGKFRPIQKGWEMGVLAASFPLLLLLFILLISPIYIMTGAAVLVQFMVGICLLAIYALVPAPFFHKEPREKITEFYQHLKGCTFGLDVYWSSSWWYWILVITVLFFSLMTWMMTYFNMPINIIIYFFSFFFALICAWIYNKFFQHA